MPLKGEARKEYMKKHYAENKGKYAASSRAGRIRRMEKLNAIKAESGPCVDCGGTFPPYCMDFDHVNGDKIGDVSDLVQGSSWQSVVDEIAKCELICANCHRMRTYSRFTSHMS